jgi:hypothetical protein
MRTLLASALLFALAPLAAAQPTFGVRAGLNVADVSDVDFDRVADFETDGQPRLGFVGGVFAEIPLTPTFAVRPEVLYSQKGARAVAADDADDDVSLDLDYIEVPVLARVGFPASPTLEVALLAGPSIGFRLSDNLDDIDDFGDDDAVTSTDYAAVVGGEIGSGPFFVDLRYTFGLGDLGEDFADEIGVDTDSSPRNGVFAVTASYKFGR